MISLIVAYSKNRVIGREGKIPWKLENEQKRFKTLTTGNVVIMGRRTYEEIGRPLPNRTNVVVSATKSFDGCTTVKTLFDALEMFPDREIFIAGGSRLYEESLTLVDVMYITEIEAFIDGDTYFPEFDESLFERREEEYIDGEIPYRYVTYIRKK